MEHRWGKRSSVDIPVVLHAGSGSRIRGRMANLSLSGALVLTDVRLPVFSQVMLELEGLWSNAEMPPIAAYVARAANGGIGLEWDEFSPLPIAELLSPAAATLPAHDELCPQHDGRLRSVLVGGPFERRLWR